MDKHTLSVLEFKGLLDLLAGQAVSEPGIRLCRLMRPDLTEEQAEAAWRLIDEAKELYTLEGTPPLAGFPEISPVLAQLDTDGLILDPQELVLVSRAVRVIRLVKNFVQAHREAAPLLWGKVGDLPSLSELERVLASSVGPEGEILDTASRKLAQVRREIIATRTQVRTRLNGLINSQELKHALQDDIITERSGRYVIPVRASMFREVPGLVHDTSSSGATSYIEPLEVVEENNRLNMLKGEEKREVDRILAELSRQVAAERFQIAPACRLLAEVDRIFASGKLSLKTGARAPLLSHDRSFDLRQARHPLLIAKPEETGRKLVPLDLRFDEDTRMMILSGVNAGGKTAALKTAGLLCLMAQAGLHLPVAEGGRLPFFDRIIAVVGDEQDLQSDLSTFSAHIRRLKEALDLATDRSLVLLDELGTGTDPAEGAALALALMHEFLERGTLVMIATHFHLLKAYAQQTAGAVNVSVKTNERGQPIFGLDYGTPGFSGGLSMARNLGLDPSIVSRAESFMDEGQKKTRQLMENLEEERAALATARDEQKFLNDKLDSALAELELAEENHQKSRKKELEIIRADGLQAIARAESEFKDLIKKVSERGKASGREITKFHVVKKELKEIITPKDREYPPIADPQTGEQVLVRSLGAQGRILALNAGLDQAEVEIRGIKVKTTLKDLARPEPGQADQAAEKPRKSIISKGKFTSPAQELNVIGLTVDEAIPAVDKMLDQAQVKGLNNLSIVHGKGTGRLREAIRMFMQTDTRVKTFHPGADRAGGEGITVVELFD